MRSPTARDIEAWEDEGGAAAEPLDSPAAAMRGTTAQVEWALRIKRQVNAEFDRVVALFRSVAGKQDSGKRADTEAIIAMVEEKRHEVMSRDEAGYFIRDWQEISDQVRRMVLDDPRYEAIRNSTVSR
jgi:hypothetical protein